MESERSLNLNCWLFGISDRTQIQYISVVLLAAEHWCADGATWCIQTRKEKCNSRKTPIWNEISPIKAVYFHSGKAQSVASKEQSNISFNCWRLECSLVEEKAKLNLIENSYFWEKKGYHCYRSNNSNWKASKLPFFPCKSNWIESKSNKGLCLSPNIDFNLQTRRGALSCVRGATSLSIDKNNKFRFCNNIWISLELFTCYSSQWSCTMIIRGIRMCFKCFGT